VEDGHLGLATQRADPAEPIGSGGGVAIAGRGLARGDHTHALRGQAARAHPRQTHDPATTPRGLLTLSHLWEAFELRWLDATVGSAGLD
jgi:hypothetical protein